MPAPPSSLDSKLYGAPRPKNKPIPLSSTSIQSLSTELALARSRLSSEPKSTAARPRTSTSKSIFKTKNSGVEARAQRDATAGRRGGSGGVGAEGEKLSEREWERRKKRLQEKAKIYDKLKKGEVEDDGAGGGLTLVDFDRKWAEREKAGRVSDDDDEDNDDEDRGRGRGRNEEDPEDEMVEYIDEFGRTRKATKSAIERERRQAEREEEASVKPKAPENVIYGDTIQSHAFQTPEFRVLPRKGELEALLPTEEEEEKDLETHYDATKEVRTKGVGFYQFSTDNAERRKELEELERERERTEKERREKEERRKRKREELEKRKEEVRKKRREKVGENWLSKFEGELGGLP